MGRNGIITWGVLFASLVFFCADPGVAQFMVRPMRLHLQAPPGRFYRTGFALQNYDANSTNIIDVHVVELGQNEDGTWRSIEDPNIDTSHLASCKDWITLSQESVEVGPLRSVPVGVTFEVPGGIHGTYAAGIIASLRPRTTVEGVGAGLRLRFLIPVTLEILGRAVRHKIEATDVGMEFREPTVRAPATTLVSMTVENNGATYSQLRPGARVLGFVDGHWREIATLPLRTTGILPGLKLKLTGDVGRSLPSGKYRIQAVLYVDGRRATQLAKEVEFAGDPTVTEVVTDAALDLEPGALVIEAIPGAVRMGSFRVYNASDDTVNVTAGTLLPPNLEGVKVRDVVGQELGCAQWLEIAPKTFKLRPRGRQTMRIVAKMPNPGPQHPCYYAMLALQSRYPDGQDAGVTTGYICVDNQKVQATPFVHPLRLSLQLQESEKYIVVARFGNFGAAHFTPRCRAMALTPDATPMARTVLSGEAGLMLPLQVRDFSGVIDFSGFPEGVFRLRGILEYGPGSGQSTFTERPIQVTVENETRVVRIIQPEEYEDTIGVEW
jgi:hypothetical protein